VALVRKLFFGLLLGTGIAFFARYRGAFSTVTEPPTEPWPDLERVREPEPLAESTEDRTIVDRVQSEVLGDDRFKGSVNVTSEFGRILLHGKLESADLIDELVARVRDVEGVRDVDSRLHTPEIEAELPKRPQE
jgi:hypothetical protein